MKLNRIIWTVAGAIMAIAANTAIVPDARAGIQVFYFTTTASNAPCPVGVPNSAPSYRVKYSWQFEGCPGVSFFTRWRYPLGATTTCAPDAPSYNPSRSVGGSANGVTWAPCSVNNQQTQSDFDHAIMSASVPLSGFPDVYCECVGDVIAGPGQLGTSATVGDTVNAFVGSRGNPMRVNVARTVRAEGVPGDTLTLSNLTGQMYINPGRTRKGSIRASFTVAVYKDSTTAFNANPLARGQALFWGRVHLNKDLNNGKAFGMDGDFSGSDFTSPTDSTAAPGTINKIVPLAGAAEPVVMIYSDPMLGPVLPGTSPAGILALTAAMAGAGMWVMVRRRRRNA